MRYLIAGLTIFLLVATPVNSYEINTSYKKLDGSIVNFNQFEGKYLLVDTMATWCLPCKDSMSHLEIVNSALNENISLISISIDPVIDDIKALSEFKEKYDADWEFGIDVNLEFVDKYSIKYLPTLIFFDPDGKILKMWTPGVTPSDKILDEVGKYVEIDRDSGRGLQISDFLDFFGEARFVLFLVILWILTIYLIIQMFRKKKLAAGSKQTDIKG